ncbi:hypothetical protein P4S54_22510 [Shewanella sp. PP-He15 brown]|jgi:hypothetical protein|uniref:hypothetical protein n=1 Tax=Shewanella sp. SR1 TaxID=2855505 RepID=UPI001CF41BF2|nr:hypothetical protein [Shewanella sp. SR1]MCB2380840.1 hypothetical protein [Shewanella sp. SR1]
MLKASYISLMVIVAFQFFAMPNSTANEIIYNGFWTKYRVFKSVPEFELIARVKLDANIELNKVFASEIFSFVETLPEKDNFVFLYKKSDSKEIIAIASLNKMFVYEKNGWRVFEVNSEQAMYIHCVIANYYDVSKLNEPKSADVFSDVRCKR